METKQTALEFLIKAFQGAYGDKVINVISEQVEQAKEMHKQEIIDAYNQSWHFRDKPYETAEKYYNETFGK